MHSAPYFAAFGFLSIYLGLRVIRLRGQHKVSIGHGGVTELERAMRVFGNFSEYVPLGLILLIALEFVQAPSWYIHLCGLVFLAGRLLHAYGLGQPVSGVHKLRIRGMQLTFTGLALSSTGILIWSVVGP